jgi:hypothetical protein
MTGVHDVFEIERMFYHACSLHVTSSRFAIREGPERYSPNLSFLSPFVKKGGGCWLGGRSFGWRDEVTPLEGFQIVVELRERDA